MFEPVFASRLPSIGCLEITRAPIIYDVDDFKGIQIAVASLSADIGRVTGQTAQLKPYTQKYSANAAIIVGSVTQSVVIQSLIRNEKLTITSINGQWECFTTALINDPIPGVKRGLVIAGSDKRGTIFGIYSLSEQLGISPWYWWSDVAPQRCGHIYALNISTSSKPPSVKYRGIFINDEAPSLSEWVHEKYGPHFNVEFYKRVFELLLRLKANFLWPAMWFGFPHPGNSFFVDDHLNQMTADEYGIVVSTSHHEPMQRAMNEWFDKPYFEPEQSWSWIKNKDKITRYFQEGAERAKNYESYFTMGMRGDGDRAMDVEDPKTVLADVLATQRRLIKQTYGRHNAVPQLMALYKEVQEYYEEGLEVPDDVTLLFADDNFGSVRRLPQGSESNRHGGAGLYYHLEYVGEPRSYKWLNSNSCAKVWHQLDLAHNRGADQVWVFNVGDLKPMELPLTLAMAVAWNTEFLDMDQLDVFFLVFARNTFMLGEPEALECAKLLLEYDRLVALRKHEHIEPDTFSIINYAEADMILARWRTALKQAERLEDSICEELRPAYYQLILHPIKASYIYVALRVNQAKNQLYALQRRSTTNKFAQEVLRLFDKDFDLSEEYHQMLNGKWNHVMRQPHYGNRDTYHTPCRDMLSGLCFVQRRQNSSPIAGWIGVAVEGHAGVRPGLVNEEGDRTHPSRRDHIVGVTLPNLDPFGPPRRHFEIFSRGTREVSWKIASAYTWLVVSPSQGTIDPESDDTLVTISVDWNAVPIGLEDVVLLDLTSDLGDFEQIHVPVNNRTLPPKSNGFVESDGHIAIHAASHCNDSVENYRLLPFIGRAPTGGVTLRNGVPPDQSEFLQYPIVTFTPTPAALLTLQFTLTLDTDSNHPITYDIRVDDGSITTHRMISSAPRPGHLPDRWLDSVMDCIWTRSHSVNLRLSGQHTISVRLNSQNCILEKIIVDLGGVRQSYIGPPESSFRSAS